MGQTTFGEPLNYKVSQNAAAIEADEEAMAILATGDTHVAIEAGKYVYVRDHSTLARGLYKNTSGSTIAANDPLSSSNLTATTEGGLNELNSNIANLLTVEEYTGTTPATGGLSINVGSFDNIVEWVVYIERNSYWYNETGTTYFDNGQVVFYFGGDAAQNREKAYRVKVIKKHG